MEFLMLLGMGWTLFIGVIFLYLVLDIVAGSRRTVYSRSRRRQ